MTDRVGQQLGNYGLIRLLGRGGFAEVYLGEHLRLRTQAAIKVLHTSLEDDDVESFLREAQMVARLKHPHIVRVFDFDVENYTPFLVMDYLPNGNVRRSHPKGVSLPLSTIVSYVTQVASALQYAHDEKLIHRDIKPENMLLDRDNTLVLSDFGIALMSQSSRSQSTQEVVGTATYMAPEQFQGHPRRASDQYALAVVVYEWLTGDRPFQGSFSEIASQHLFVPPHSLRGKVPTISLGVEQVVQIALAKDPEQRFGSVQAFASALEQAWQAEQLPTTPILPVSASGPPAQPTRETQSSSSTPTPQAFANQGRASEVPVALPSVAETASTSSVSPLTEVPPAFHPRLPSSPAPGVLTSDHNLFAITPPTHQAFPSTDHQTAATWLPYALLLVGLVLLVIVGSAGLFIYSNQAATNQTNVTTTTPDANATTVTDVANNATATSITQASAAIATATGYQDLYNHSTSGTPVLSDPLSDNSRGNGWGQGTHCQFVGGAYYVNMAVTDSFWACDAESTDFNNFAYQVQVRIVNGDAGGIAFRATTPNNIYVGYAFTFRPNGSYQFCVVSLNSSSCSLSGFSRAINEGLNQTNLVTVITRGGTITLYVNQQVIGSVTDSTFSHGSVGVIAEDFGNPTEVASSNAIVWIV